MPHVLQFRAKSLSKGEIMYFYRGAPVQDPVLIDGEEAVHGPGEVVRILEVAQAGRDDLGCVGSA